MPRFSAIASRTLFRFAAPALLASLLVASTLLVASCGDDEEENTGTDTNLSEIAEEDQSGDTSGSVELSGEDITYRLLALELTEPDVSMRVVLNTLIEVNIKAAPDNRMAVHVLVQLRNWDLTVTPISLELAGGAGMPDTSGAEVTYSFHPDAELAYVGVEPVDVDGIAKLQTVEPTQLFFPVILETSDYILPLRQLNMTTCWGRNASCAGTDQSEIFGLLDGGIIESEADDILVELSDTDTMPLGEVLRDPRGECAGDGDCTDGRVCGQTSQLCERPTDMTVNGEPAFFMAGRFVARTITFVE